MIVVSVLLPVFDAADTLELCLRSVARQTEARFECVVVDDGSRDDSLAIARAFAIRDERFIVLACPHRGLIDALNEGIAYCRAPIVMRMDADDIMHRDRMRLQLAAFTDELDAVGCHVRLFPRSQLRDGLRAYERWLHSIVSAELVEREAFVECPVAHPTLAVRTNVLRDFGYRERGWPEDYDLVLRLLQARHRISVVPKRLLMWRDGPARLSRTHPRYEVEQFTACKAHFLASTFLADRDVYALWGYGDTGKSLRKALLEYGKSPSVIVELHPGRIGQVIHGARVIPPPSLADHRDLPIAVSVAGIHARTEIRGAMAKMGFEETRHYVCCA